MRPKLFKVGPCSGEMSTKLPTDGSAIQSSYNTTNNNNPLSPVPSEGGLGQESRATKPAPAGDLDKVPTSCTKVLTDDVNLANVYEENCVNDNHCDSTKMSPVEGPVNDIPKTMFDKSHDLSGDTTTTTHQGEGCEQFSGQIVYNPDGSAYIIEENDETLLDQIPTQEGSIVERAGKCLPEVEYPKIDQVDTNIFHRSCKYFYPPSSGGLHRAAEGVVQVVPAAAAGRGPGSGQSSSGSGAQRPQL